MSAQQKVAEIFKELAGGTARRLDPALFLADVNTRITAACSAQDPDDSLLQYHDQIGFHLVDWQGEAAFIVALSLFPERFTDEEIREGVEAFLIHVPAHVAEAARLAGVDTTTFHETPSEKPNDPRDPTA